VSEQFRETWVWASSAGSADRRERPLGEDARLGSPRAPSWFATLQQATSVPIARYSFESVESMKDRQAILSVRRELQIARPAWRARPRRSRSRVSVPKLSLTTLDVSFDAILDPEERAYFMRLPPASCCRPKTSTGCARLPPTDA